MTDKTSLGDRMKMYEANTSGVLLRRTPAIVRVDGKAFHTYTNIYDVPGAALPWSDILHRIMRNTAQAMCSQMQGAVLAYQQSDEISIFLRDYDDIRTQAWFGGNLQKICSVSAAMASAYFNFFVAHESKEVGVELNANCVPVIPIFDARVFNVPREDVTNYFVWRQKDATRNSVSMLARHYFSHRELNGKSHNEKQDMLWSKFSINWNDCEVWQKRGACVIRNPNTFDSSTAWVQDMEIPIFTQDRDYIERLVYPEPNDV